MASGYTLAGFETLLNIIYRFMKSDEFDNNFQKEDIAKIFTNKCNKFLHSYGQNFKNKKNHSKYSISEAKCLKECQDYGFAGDSSVVLDSGGFQASTGMLTKHETDVLMKIYYQFLIDYPGTYQRAFILDISPGPGCKLFNNFYDVYNINFDSYTKARKLPKEIKDKIIYIHHFRTPKLWEIFSSLLNHENMFNDFKYHATGGIVANMVSDMTIPCIIYILPLIPLINQALKFKRKDLHFHILGGATHRDLLFYELFKKIIREKHGIELHITYDSSTIFKGFMIARYIPLMCGDMVIKTDLRTHCLNMRFNDEGTVAEVYKKRMRQFAEEYNLKPIDENKKIYNPATGTFYTDYKIYSMLYMISLFDDIEKLFRDKVDNLYEIYKAGDIHQFTEDINLITKNINSGRQSKKQRSKSTAISRSLDMLQNLDEDYCAYIVNKNLAKDEFVELTDNRLLSF